MKETLKELGSIFAEIITAVVIIVLITHAALIVFSYNALADEALTPDERVVALTLLGEARGEGKRGMYAVACVIQLRSEQRKLTPAQVCKQSKQFDTWTGKTERELWHLWKSTSAPYARELARYLCRGYKFAQDYTGNANHFHAKSVKPYWTYKKIIRNNRIIRIDIKPTKIIGNHLFYKL